MIIDRTYFTGPLVIPQIGSVPVQDTVDGYIALYEPELLSKAIGESFYSELLAGLDEVSPEQKWVDIRDGLMFTNFSNRAVKWVGLTPENKIPGGPIASFVWFHYTRDTAAQNSGVGVVSATSENAVVISPTFKLSQAWNCMVKDINVLWEFLNANTDVYTGWNRAYVCYSFFGTINAFGI